MLHRRRQGGEVAAEYREFYGEHAYDEQGNYIGPDYQTEDAEGAAAADTGDAAATSDEVAPAAEAGDTPEG